MPERAGQFQKGELVPGTPYRVEELIGSGGMGSVYRVEHAELGRRFVLKALHGHLASRPDLVARLKNEWRALGKLEHPNIVQVTDAGQTDSGLPFYVMEHLRGTTLGQLLMARGRLGAREGCLLVVDILAGLHAAHKTGAVHRDIKPPNIFIVEGGRAKLLDFGIAKLRDQSAKVVTAGGISIGTPRYMAPEQASGTRVDGRADIYATALVLYEMVVGKGPFSHIRDPNELVMAHIGQEPERADFLEPRVPAELGDLLQRWLSKSPDSRPATAEFARRELLALAESLPSEQATVNEEVTVGGAYDASTLGGCVSVFEKEKSLAGSASVVAPATVAASEIARSTAATVTVGTQDVVLEPREVVGTGALGRGPAGVDRGPDAAPGFKEVESLRSDAAVKSDAVDKGDIANKGDAALRGLPGRRASVTPPPISSLRPGHRDASRTTLKWIAGTAVASFLLAWGISRAMQAPPVAVPEAQDVASALKEGGALSEQAASVRAENGAVPPSPDVAPGPGSVPATDVLDSSVPLGTSVTRDEPVETPGTGSGGTRGATVSTDATAQVKNSAESGTKVTRPAARPPLSPQKPSPSPAAAARDSGEQLPESGLW